MGRFLFKQFSVKQEQSAMKVNTDGVLLGAWCSMPPVPREGDMINVLDVGTGTGVIALMVAQRLAPYGIKAQITGIDPDIPSACEAQSNFSESSWGENMMSQALSLKEYLETSPPKANLIVSNPPYFKNSLKAPCSRRSNARHTDNLSFSELIECSASLLSPGGVLSVILPAEAEREFVSVAASNGLSLFRLCRVSTVAGEEPRRIMMEFTGETSGDINEERLSIQKSPGGLFTNEYKMVTADFYLKF